MAVLVAPFVVAASMLALAGAQKLLDPRNAVGALRALGIPATDGIVRAGSAAELVVGSCALALGTPVLAVLVAASYLAFAAFVALALRRGTPIGTCGCFGREETPPSAVHVVADLALAAVAFGWIAVGSKPPVEVAADTPGEGLVLAGLCALSVWLLLLVFTALPRTLAVARRVGV